LIGATTRVQKPDLRYFEADILRVYRNVALAVGAAFAACAITVQFASGPGSVSFAIYMVAGFSSTLAVLLASMAAVYGYQIATCLSRLYAVAPRGSPDESSSLTADARAEREALRPRLGHPFCRARQLEEEEAIAGEEGGSATEPAGDGIEVARDEAAVASANEEECFKFSMGEADAEHAARIQTKVGRIAVVIIACHAIKAAAVALFDAWLCPQGTCGVYMSRSSLLREAATLIVFLPFALGWVNAGAQAMSWNAIVQSC
jgi:hypothetical protein